MEAYFLGAISGWIICIKPAAFEENETDLLYVAPSTASRAASIHLGSFNGCELKWKIRFLVLGANLAYCSRLHCIYRIGMRQVPAGGFTGLVSFVSYRIGTGSQTMKITRSTSNRIGLSPTPKKPVVRGIHTTVDGTGSGNRYHIVERTSIFWRFSLPDTFQTAGSIVSPLMKFGRVRLWKRKTTAYVLHELLQRDT